MAARGSPDGEGGHDLEKTAKCKGAQPGGRTLGQVMTPLAVHQISNFPSRGLSSLICHMEVDLIFFPSLLYN